MTVIPSPICKYRSGRQWGVESRESRDEAIKTRLARSVGHGSETDRARWAELLQLFHPHSRTDADDHLALQSLCHALLREDPCDHLGFTAEEDDIALLDRLEVTLRSSQYLDPFLACSTGLNVFHRVQRLAQLAYGLFPPDRSDEPRGQGRLRCGQGEGLCRGREA